MLYRKALMKDAKCLDNLLTKLIQDERQYDDNIDENFRVTNFYQYYIQDKTKLLFLAEDNNKIIGYIYGYFDKDATTNNKVAYLDALFIDNEYRHQGIANKLINEFKKWARENNCTSMEVNVCSNNIKAKNLYLKNNFQTFKETLKCKIV